MTSLNLNLKWFKAADIVTRYLGVGAADGINFGVLIDSSEDFLKKGNEYLFAFNMDNAKKIIMNGSLTGSFINAEGDIINFTGKTGVELDYALVEYEQTKINSFITDYKITNGLSDAEMNAILDDISKSMNWSWFAIDDVMDQYFPGLSDFNFGVYRHRVILGQGLIDNLHDN